MKCSSPLLLCVVVLAAGLPERIAFGAGADSRSGTVAASGCPSLRVSENATVPFIEAPNRSPPSSPATSQTVAPGPCQDWPCGDFSREPPDFNPWWEEAALRPLRPECPPLQMQLESVVLGTLCFSPQVHMMRQVAPIREDSIVEAQGDFDVRAFAESKFIDTSDPIGSELIAPLEGDRYLDQNWYQSVGLRKKGLSGAQIELSQKIGYENSNSQWFTPELQGTARMTLTITQPLLNGAGKAYNSRLVVLAQIDAQSGRDHVAKDLQTLMIEIYQTYWDLHLQRALLLQKRRLYERGVEICRELEGRRDVDAVGGQLARAKPPSPAAMPPSSARRRCCWTPTPSCGR